MNDIMEYIGVAGLVAIPVMLNEDQIESVKRGNGSIKNIALFAACEYSLLGFVLVPMLFENFLAGEFLDKLVYYAYMCVNFFIQLLLIHKKVCRSTKNKVYNILKYIWIIGIIAYTVILGAGAFFKVGGLRFCPQAFLFYIIAVQFALLFLSMDNLLNYWKERKRYFIH